MKLYRIRDWNRHFENAKSRTIANKIWCSMPNKQDGLGYGRLLRMKNGPALYGAFVAVALCASKQRYPRDGYLTDTGGATGCPLSALDLSVKTQFPEELIQQMLDATSSESIGWIEVLEVSSECPPSIPQVSAAISPKREGRKEGREEGEGHALSVPGVVAEIPSVAEVIEEGKMRGVPESFCRHYHAVCTEKHRWLVKAPNGERVIGWRSELKRWWEKDRHNWQGEDVSTTGTRGAKINIADCL